MKYVGDKEKRIDCLIGLEDDDGTIKGIVCREKGFMFDEVPIKLITHFSTPKRVIALFNKGNLIRLGKELRIPQRYSADDLVYKNYADDLCISTNDIKRKNKNHWLAKDMGTLYRQEGAISYTAVHSFIHDSPETYGYLYLYSLKDRKWYILAGKRFCDTIFRFDLKRMFSDKAYFISTILEWFDEGWDEEELSEEFDKIARKLKELKV